jgi:hypothetical protein
VTIKLTAAPSLRELLFRCGTLTPGYPVDLLAATRERFVADVQERMEADAHEIAIAVARYNVAHVSDKNKAWAERRLQEELEKEARRNQ